jgi:DNA-binding MarR family transcriptional regulator
MRAHRQVDLSVPQFRTLAFLCRNPGSSLSAAAEFIGLTLPTMSVLIEGLVQRGLVQRSPDLRDRRRVLLTLTAEGLAVYAGAVTGAEQWLAELLAPMTATDRDGIVRALTVLEPLFARSSTPVPLRQE